MVWEPKKSGDGSRGADRADAASMSHSVEPRAEASLPKSGEGVDTATVLSQIAWLPQ